MMKPFSSPRLAALAALALAAAPALAQSPAAEATVNKGDVAWLLTSTLLVIMMSLPGIALFYGGLARSKNMLSVLVQVFTVFSLVCLLWAVYGYSLAFSGGGAIYGDFAKLFLSGVGVDSLGDTFSPDAKIPELAFVAFQCSFAAISCAIIVGSFGVPPI